MNPDKSTCWYDPLCYKEMIAGAKGELWPVLENSSHWPVLEELLMAIPFSRRKQLLDVGCGAGCLGTTGIVKNTFDYTGVDIPEVINNVAREASPENNYFEIDMVNANNLDFINGYDVVVMNAFIDVMHNPLDMLHNILDNCTKHVIIHRQFVIGGPTKVKKASSYGKWTFISHINELEFNNAIRHFKVIKKLGTGLGADNYSYLLERAK